VTVLRKTATSKLWIGYTMLPGVEDTPSPVHREGDAVGTTKVELRRSSGEHEAVTGQKWRQQRKCIEAFYNCVNKLEQPSMAKTGGRAGDYKLAARSTTKDPPQGERINNAEKPPTGKNTHNPTVDGDIDDGKKSMRSTIGHPP
jgi:hypothetical protein